jgi:hypothetical protein
VVVVVVEKKKRPKTLSVKNAFFLDFRICKNRQSLFGLSKAIL